MLRVMRIRTLMAEKGRVRPTEKKRAASPTKSEALPMFSDRPRVETTKALTNLEISMFCNSKLALCSHVVMARVVTTHGVAPVQHGKKRCSNKKCREYHCCNYVRIDSANINFVKTFLPTSRGDKHGFKNKLFLMMCIFS